MLKFKYMVLMLSLFVVFALLSAPIFAMQTNITNVDENYSISTSTDMIALYFYPKLGYWDDGWVWIPDGILRCTVTDKATGACVYDKTAKTDFMGQIAVSCCAMFDVTLHKGDYSMKISYRGNTRYGDSPCEKWSNISIHD